MGRDSITLSRSSIRASDFLHGFPMYNKALRRPGRVFRQEHHCCRAYRTLLCAERLRLLSRYRLTGFRHMQKRSDFRPVLKKATGRRLRYRSLRNNRRAVRGKAPFYRIMPVFWKRHTGTAAYRLMLSRSYRHRRRPDRDSLCPAGHLCRFH